MDQKQLWVLQLVRYFLFHKQYTQVRFVNAANGQTTDNETWLANPDAFYPIIYISPVSPKETLPKSEFINRQAASLMNVLGKKGKVLIIYLDPVSYYQEEEQFIHLSLYPNAQIPDSILRTFNGLNNVVFNVDNPEAEMANLNSAITSYAMAHNNPKARNRRELINSFSNTFKIAGALALIIYLAIVIISAIGKFDGTSVAIVFGAYYKEFITVLHEYWRLLTAGFVHASIIHLWINLTSLYNISKTVEDKLGFARTFVILIVSIIIGNICVYAGDKNIVAVGMSGGIYGLFAAMTVIYWKEGYFKIPVLRNRLISNIYINILINFLPYVSVLGHLGGFVAGLFLAFIFLDFEKSVKINFAVAGCAIIIALGFLGVRNQKLDEMYLGTDRQVIDIYRKAGLNGLADNINDKITEYYVKEFVNE